MTEEYTRSDSSMLGTLVAALVETSIINLRIGTEIMIQAQKTLKPDAVRDEADLVREKFLALRQAFEDALSSPVPADQGLLSIIRANYERRLAERND
jgi:hypothetical protein